MPSLTKRALLTGAMLGAGALASGLPAHAEDARAGGPFVAKRRGVFNGKRVDYIATVGETVLVDSQGAATLRLVTTSYVAAQGSPTRPVLFVFNGGPSSSSATLHTVALGPRRVVIAQDVKAPQPPPQLVDNDATVLDVADLVFIDPAETGFSRIAPAGSRERFYSADGDAQSIADFVVAWSKANGREASPKYVLGESYGTVRASLMAGKLSAVMPLEGVFLFGQAANMIETSQRARNIVSYATNLPQLASIAAYHGRADTGGLSATAFIDKTYAFAMSDYLLALAKGQDLPAAERRQMAEKLQALTGISVDYYLAHDLVISKVAFGRELLKDQGLILGTYDARYTGPAPAPGARPVDPAGRITGAIAPMIAEQLKSLGVTWPLSDYRDIAPGSDAWTWSPTGGMGGPFWDYDYPAQIQKAFKANPKFRLMVGTGIYDLTTTVGPARYLVSSSDFPRERVFLRQYVGGHMAYSHLPSLKAFTDDIRAFVTGGAPA
ncbi:S10 family peptidase [Caulobacter soli]|uniref:S10 family peptidase n=1 Tax=Caulobacter soli TaxID=2708539 RepID=UPI0013EB1DED|nr:peptidase S10 [Caulobacter soli]